MKTEALHSWAVSQGANHYLRNLGQPAFIHSVTEGVSLLLEEGSPLSLRLAGCLLFHTELNASKLTEILTRKGRINLSHIVACGQTVEPSNPLWGTLTTKVGAQPLEDAPHWSRFCTQGREGFSFMGQNFIWLKPNKEGFEVLKQQKAYAAW
jgi:hypothetical protein